MKNNNRLIHGDLFPLTIKEQIAIKGGSGIWEIGDLISGVAYYIWKFGKDAAEYQSSLPANLKK